MGADSFEFLRRQARRSARIVKNSNSTAIKVAGEPVTTAKTGLDNAQKVVTSAVTKDRKERKERDAAVKPLHRVYNEVHSATLSRLPHAELPDRAAAQSTPDDLLTAGESVELLLLEVGGVDDEHPIDGTDGAAPTGETWALDLVKELKGPLDVANKEYLEAVDASEKLQKALTARAEARASLAEALKHFRRVVRDVYGAHSKEYHGLCFRGITREDKEGE